MEPEKLNARAMDYALDQILGSRRLQMTADECSVPGQAVRRFYQHELLVREVLPDLRSRLDGIATAGD